MEKIYKKHKEEINKEVKYLQHYLLYMSMIFLKEYIK